MTTTTFFKDITSLSSQINTLITIYGKTLSAAIDSLVRGGGLGLASARRLHFFQDLTADENLLKVLAEKYGDSDPSLSKIALEHYYDGLSTCDSAAVATLRNLLWEKEPLAVLLVTLRTKRLLSTTSTDLKPQVEKALQAALDRNLPLTSPEFRALLEETQQNTASPVYDIINALQRLHCLVLDPSHIEVLLRRGIRSAHDIAILPQSIFLSVIDEERRDPEAVVKVDEESAIRIHDHATTIDCRNQETWANILDELKGDFQMVVSKTKASPASENKAASNKTVAASPHGHYNMTSIFNLQSSPCDECCSVTGPSAYFVDLLNFLKSCPCSTSSSNSRFRTLFDALTSRRPDLYNLELSCANSKNMLPYISIVNEVLGSFILNQSGNVKNETEEKAVADVNPLQDYEVFASDSMRNLMFPMNVFPFNQGLNAIKIYLAGAGLAPLDVVEIFGSDARILSEFQNSLPAEESSRIALLAAARSVSRRAAIAESLNLQPAEVAAITKETIYTPGFMRDVTSLRSKRGNNLIDMLAIPLTHENWGYENPSDMVNADEAKGLGLSFIYAQLLPRSGLSFEEVLEMLESLYFGGRLVIANPEKVGGFSGAASEMRLQTLNVAAKAPTEKVVGPLTEEVCHEIQAFIRLKNRLGWTISKLDTVLSALLENQGDKGIIRTVGGARGISFRLLEDVSFAKKLSELVKMPIDSILPLWASIGKHGKGSLFERVFLKPPSSVMLGDEDIFSSLDERREPVRKHIPALMAVLRLSHDELTSLMVAAGIQRKSAELTSDTLAQLYRHTIMCRMLRAKPTQYLDILPLLPTGVNLFQDPETTFRHVERWLSLLRNDWSIMDIVTAIHAPSQTVSTLDDSQSISGSMGLTRSMVEELDALDSLWEPRIRSNIVRYEDVVEICGEIYDETTATAVAEFIEGIQVTSKSIPITKPTSGSATLSSNLLALKELPSNLSLVVNPGAGQNNGTILLILTGVLSSKNRTAIMAGKTAESVPELVNLLDELVERSTAAYKSLSGPLFDGLSGSTLEKFTAMPKVDVRDETSGLSAEDESVQVEMVRKARRTAFISAVLPTLRNQLIQKALISAIDQSVPGLEQPILTMLATQPLDERGISASEAIQNTCATLTASDEMKNVKSALFCPVASDAYQFRLVREGGSTANANNETPTFAVNGIDLPLTKATGSEDWQSKPIMLGTGQPYTLTSSVSLETARWINQQSPQPNQFPKSTLIPTNTISSIANVLVQVWRFARLIKKLDVGLDELNYISSGPRVLGDIDMNNLSIQALCEFEKYKSLRDSVPDGASGMVTLLTWLESSSPDGTSLASNLAKATGWPKSKLNDVIDLKYPGLKQGEIIKLFAASLDELTDLRAIMELSDRLSAAPGQHRSQPLATLFQIATPTPPTQPEKDLEAASALQLCLGEGQLAQGNSELRETQRTALVQYILQQKSTRDLGIFDADDLFAHLLLDVQMGPKLEITRTKAAISSVQLFVQRVLLGLEKDVGVATALVDKEKWAWMQRHNAWQATRKAFLYPENWIDPSLRDDKTPQFEAYEAAITSQDLSWSSFSQAIRGYVQSLLGIADLDIVSYLRELREGSAEIYHFFGRTRSAPFELHYRTMRISRSGSSSGLVFWSSWRKIEVEAPTYEANWDGQTLDKGGCYLIPVVRNNRLFLYLPQLIAKALAPKPKVSVMKMAEAVPETLQGPYVWEIRMGWTELVDGEWTPKRVAQGALVVDWDDSATNLGRLPSVDAFVFNSRPEGPKATIHVGCHKSGKFHKLGQFDMSDERVTMTKHSDQKTALGDTLGTSFHKYSWTSPSDATLSSEGEMPIPTASAYSVITQKAETPLLAVGKRTDKRKLNWTISYSIGTNNTNKTTGLVADELKEGADGTTYFMYPTAEKPPNSLASALLYKSSNEEVIEHTESRELMEAVCQPDDGLGTLFQTMDRKLISNQNYGKRVAETTTAPSFHELATSYSIYNWELGLHAVLLAVDRFHATQQFELALKAARLVFDPTAKPAPSSTPAQVAAACWRFRPFRELAEHRAGMKEELKTWPDNNTLDIAVSERRSNPSTTHSTARGRPQVYMKWIVMKYIEILVAAGDEYFRKGSMETLPLAIQRYIEATHVLGPEAPKVPRLGKAVVRTARQIRNPGSIHDLELAFPFMCEVERRGSAKAADDKRSRYSLLCVLTTTYFCLPPNPQYASLRSLVQDRLFKARNNLDINGRPIVYSMTEPYLDPSDVMNALANGGSKNLESLMNDADSPMPYTRFAFLISKALELCNDLRVLGDQFLAAREKRDAEALELIRARQDIVLSKMVLDVKGLEKEETDRSVESLQQSRESAVAQLRFFLSLTGDSLDLVPVKETDTWEDIEQNIPAPTSDDLRMSPHERRELQFARDASNLNILASGMEELVGFLESLPEVESNAEPMGCGVTIKADASNVASLIKGVAGATKMMAMVNAHHSDMSGRVGGLIRQLQERRLQANVLGREIKNIDKQIDMQRKRLEIIAKETEMQRKDIEFAIETEAWYRSKYTNEQLYAWLEASVRSMHYDMYTLTADTCRRAERAFKFERGAMCPGSFLRAGGYWNSSRDGLLAVDQLALDLRRMEAAYIHGGIHDWELTKNISIRRLDPQALLTLRETGTATFSLPEQLFDLDFPGHYMRRIKTVSLSIPCVIGPYATLPATLNLLQHTYRVKASATDAESYLAASSSDGSFRTDPVPVYATATSSSIQDDGTFDLGFISSDESTEARYGPFEGAGAISSWKLDLPPVEFQPFDYSTISDVVLHVQYTALDGGPVHRRSARDALREQCARSENLGARDGLWGFVEPRNETAGQWATFKSLLSKSSSAATTATLDIGAAMAARLPFWTRVKKVKIESFAVLVTGDAKVADQLTIPALSGAWEKKKTGKRILLAQAGISQVDLQAKASELQIEVAKAQNTTYNIEDLAVFFRYVVGA